MNAISTSGRKILSQPRKPCKILVDRGCLLFDIHHTPRLPSHPLRCLRPAFLRRTFPRCTASTLPMLGRRCRSWEPRNRRACMSNRQQIRTGTGTDNQPREGSWRVAISTWTSYFRDLRLGWGEEGWVFFQATSQSTLLKKQLQIYLLVNILQTFRKKL